MAAQIQLQGQLPDTMLAEVWTVMQLACSPDMVTSYERTRQDSDSGGFSAECDDVPGSPHSDVLESDSPFDSNANESNVDDRQAMKEAADALAMAGDSYDDSHGDSYGAEKEEENKVVNDIVQYLHSIAPGIDASLEKQFCSSTPPLKEIFQDGLMKQAYKDISAKFEQFLVGDEGFTKIAIVTHITKGVTDALKDSLPKANFAFFLSYRFVTENFAGLILKNGGLRNLVTSKSKH